MSSSTTNGDLKITSVRSSAFSTTVEVTLTLREAIVPEDLIAIEKQSIGIVPTIDNPHLDGVRRLSPNQVAIVIVGGPLPDPPGEITVTVAEYVVVRPVSGGERVIGPLTARASTVGGRPQASASAGFTVEVAGGLRWVIENSAYDGYVLRANYRLEGDTSALLMFSPAPVAGSAAVVLPLLGPVPTEAKAVDVRLETNAPAVDIVFPALIRKMQSDVDVALAREPDGSFAGKTVVDGILVAFHGWAGGDGQLRIVATSDPGTRIAFTQSVTNVTLSDEVGGSYLFSGITGKIADGNGANSTFRFGEAPRDDESDLRLRFKGYEIEVAGAAHVALRLP